MTGLDNEDRIDQSRSVHRRQYVIGPAPVDGRTGWKHVRIEPGVHLSHCPFLDVETHTDRDGNAWTLLGTAIETRAEKGDVARSIAETSTDRVPSLYGSWSGRWLLIGQGRLHLDACGFMPCFFTDGREPWLSGSLALLREVCGDEAGTPDERELRHGAGLQWFPPPRSRLSRVRSLLPSQTVSIAGGELAPRNVFAIGRAPSRYEDLLGEVESLLVTCLERIAERFDRVWIGLTGGYDSRVLMAAALKAGIRFRTFTFLYDGMKLADRKLPREIARLAGCENVLVEPQEVDARKMACMDDHTCHNFKDRDREFFAGNYWRFAAAGDCVLKAHCFEIARCHYWKKLAHPEVPTGASIAAAFGEDPGAVAAALDEWLAWIARWPVDGLDWRDRFYHEQRLAAWCSADMQANDLLDLEFLVPANAGATLSLLLGVNRDIRMTNRHQVDLVGRMAPELLSLPFNRTSSFSPFVRLYWHARYGSLPGLVRSRATRAAAALRRRGS